MANARKDDNFTPTLLAVTNDAAATIERVLVDPTTKRLLVDSAMAANSSVNINQIGGVAVLTGNGITGTGSLRVTIASDNTAFTVNAAQSGTWTVQPGNTPNTIAWKVDGSAVTQPISAASLPLPTGASTAAKQPALGTAGVASADVITIQGVAGMTKLLVTPDSVALPANQSVNVNQIAGIAVSTAAPGTQKVGITGNAGAVMDAAGQNAVSPANELLIAGQFNTIPTTITTGNISPLQLDSSANLLVNLKTALPSGSNVIGALSANQSVNVAQMNGVATTMNSGNADAGTQRVAVSNVTDITNGLLAVQHKPAAVSTYSPTKFSDLGANVTLNVKASGGNVFAVYCYNANAANRFLQLHNTATTPVGGAAPAQSFLVPAGAAILIGTDYFTTAGLNFATGIAFAFSTTVNTYTAGVAGDQTTFINYI